MFFVNRRQRNNSANINSVTVIVFSLNDLFTDLDFYKRLETWKASSVLKTIDVVR